MPRYLATAIGYVAGSGSFVESLRELMPFIRSTRCFHAGTGVCFVPNEMLRHDADSMVVDGLKFQISRDKHPLDEVVRQPAMWVQELQETKKEPS